MSGAGQGARVRVFISYSATDRALVDPLKERLKQAGVGVWLDHEQLAPDTLDWQDAIRKGIDQATHMVYAASEAAAKSRYVVHELEMARGKQKSIICFWVRDSEWYDCTPMGWFTAKRIDGRDANFNAGVVELIKALGETVSIPVQSAPQLTPAPTAPAPTAPAPATSSPATSPPQRYPLPDVPARLATLGFHGVNPSGTPAITPPLVAIPAGQFLMGEGKEQHRVEVGAFLIAKYPVTVAEYALAVRAKAVRKPSGWVNQQQRLDHPVVYASWQDAMAYIAWLMSATGQSNWRLPSESEWEKAARWDAQRGVSLIYPWGDNFDKNRCNTRESGIIATSPVGSYPTSDTRRSGASPYGVEEMAGNVWEWTGSLYKPYPYIPSDGRENSEYIGERTLRGGSWSHHARYARTTFRNDGVLDVLVDLSNYRGFRLAASPLPTGS